jgi:hypothetical protein
MTHPFIRAAGALFAAALIGSCGNGTDLVAGVGSGGTGGVAAGPISGFGSVIVNGTRFDDTGARVSINDVPDRSVSELRLGMVVEVLGTINPGSLTGQADTIRAVFAVEGPVSAIDAATGTLVVLEQRVRVDAGTVLDGIAAISALAVNDIVQVSGLKDVSAGVVAATRIERRPPFTAGSSTFEVEGEISATTATTFRIGALIVNYALAAQVDFPAGGLATGTIVKATALQPAVAGTLTASVVRVRTAALHATGTRLEVEGYVANFISPAMFNVGNLMVNAGMAKYENGTAADLANGRRVEVEGTVAAGVLTATKVEFRSTATETSAELEGPVTDFLSLANFRVRGQLVDATGATIANGVASALANGRVVHVTGRITGGILVAAQVVFKDTMPAENTRLSVDGAITDYVSAQSFRVNGQAVSIWQTTVFAGGSAADLVNGRQVVVEGMLVSGVLNAATVTIKTPSAAQVVSTEGLIANFVSPASFTVNGQAVATNSNTLFTNGTAASLANGVRISVKGTIWSGVLNASNVEIKTSAPREVEVQGYITNYVSISNFKVNGQVVDAGTATFEGGTAAKLANGLKVHATGPVTAGVLKARKLEIDD